MVFSSATFLLFFLPIVFLLNLLMKKEYSNLFLLLASLIFYAWGEPKLVLLMMASILGNWIIGKWISRFDGIGKKAALCIGVVCNLAVLGYCKYAGFFVSIVNRLFGSTVLSIQLIALPIGISFFTFQAISYIVDVYRGDTAASPSVVNVALYISFFPQLIAGPIIKYRDINKQIEDRNITWNGVASGMKRFIYGLAKKVLIANTLGLCVDTIHAYNISQIDPKTAWIGALAYTFQIYYDFSGYSDMAIGLGAMFGFDIPENFRYPYLAHSISDFWRRWHISLGTWFREYVYIPLGGNRKGNIRTYFNLITVFFLTGLWHGAALSFVIWGLYHGFFMVMERLGLKKVLDKSKILSSIYCFLIVNFGWVLFRTTGTMSGIRYLARMIAPWRYTNSSIAIWQYLNAKTIFIGGIAIIGAGMLHILVPKALQYKWKGSVPEAIYCVLLLILSIASIVSNTYNPFIYFQF